MTNDFRDFFHRAYAPPSLNLMITNRLLILFIVWPLYQNRQSTAKPGATWAGNPVSTAADRSSRVVHRNNQNRRDRAIWQVPEDSGQSGRDYVGER